MSNRFYGLQIMVNVFSACSVVLYYNWIMLPYIILGKFESGVSSNYFSTWFIYLTLYILSCKLFSDASYLVTVWQAFLQLFKISKDFYYGI